MISFSTIKHRNAKAEAGFTMVELAIVLVISGFLITLSSVALNNQIEASNYQTAQGNIATIQQGLNAYFQKYQTLPCPASLTTAPSSASYNDSSAINCNSQYSACSAGINCPSATVAIGSLPTANLASTVGVTLSTGIDPWGDRIIYAVDRRFAQAKSYTACQGSGSLIVQDQNTNAITSQAIYVAVSLGKDRAGAYNANGTQPIACSTSIEAQNCDLNNNIFVKAPYLDTAGSASYFDDIIAWQTNPNYLTAPANVNNVMAWFDAADFCTVTTTPVVTPPATTITAWADKSISGLSMTAGTSPAYVAADTGGTGIGKGNSYINFTGGQLMSALVPVTTPFPLNTFTMIMVFYPSAVNLNPAILTAANAASPNALLVNRTFGTRSTAISLSMNGLVASTSSSTIAANTPYIATTICDASSNCSVYQNGIKIGSTSGLLATLLTPTYLNIGGTAGVTLLWGNYSGYLYEVLIYNTNLTVYQQNAVESYLAAKWGVSY